ncbi:Dipeptide transport system permease protein dppC [Vibrio nigripulchritudo SFn27]|uniref:Dipeptide transport system permease protein dppC n=1 Tax=Vibrio nigripulchritudo TaxID=28173 RepID=U4K394_9VIBR|nr:ABC transporter permease [Vibrio nigripulchritudo]CCN83813.1 Dipeptide transport system permease protein dppC [Vibrio nigripulchritudo BLFn1]CCN87179.1 Dipeptide transport system permease protein dppC [Vibrio nigripulchritudo SFn27]CCN94535.1 Dipeptide transport system permease protein dppC [Vibrio nigripulchritudo ENn2]CCO40899.1 Dipeptide transport system permease protein dppC [Vibrio nigripulchritudo SFn135]CCO54978.1 Dipeptide transport system permease protein dppC [Vibrio nigripulchrit
MDNTIRFEILRKGLRNRSFLFGGILTLFLVVVGLVSFVWTPYPVAEMNIEHRLQGMSSSHWFGTDQYGRDVLSLIMAGAQNSIMVSLVAVGIGVGIGVPLGTMAAANGGWLDALIMRINDFAFAFPALLTAVMITALAGPGAVNAIIAIGIFNIPVFARLSRGASLPLWKREYVMASKAAGKHGVLITIDHILPNIMGVLIVQASIQFALAILAEAGLSYLGLGAQPPQASWGRMLSEAQTMIYIAPQLAMIPGFAITISVLGLNMMGDGLRDVLDPRLRRKR